MQTLSLNLLPFHTESMRKCYKSRSSISVNVVLKSKKSMHVAFTAQSDGSSVYVTENEDIQYALEHHYKYGKLFRQESVEESDETNGANEVGGADESDDEGGKVRTVKVSDLAAAKDYLADTFGLSRTSLRSEKSILEAAKAQGIEFEGL